MHSPSVLRRIAAALILSAGVSGGTTAAAEPMPGDLKLGYRVYVGGVHVLDATAHLGWQAQAYRIGMQAATEGFLGRIASWRADVVSHGALRTGGLPSPQRYRSLGAWRDEPRNTVLEYEGASPRLTLAEPPPEEDREPVPDDLKPGTVDPMTAIVAALQAVGEGRGCGMTVPVYDGRQRYDLVFTATGREEIAASDLSTYAGPAEICAVDYEPVAGAWRESNRRRDRDEDRRRSSRRDANVTIWVARPHEGAPPVPVRLQGDSPLGTVIVHLAEVGTVAPSDRAELPPAR